MALTKIKLGKYIKLFSQKCDIPNLTNTQVSGVNKGKDFFEPSTQVGGDTSKYKIVPPNYFACNLMHIGRDVVLPIAYNHSNKNKIVSPAYFVFNFIENDELLSDYFFIFLNSAERDRYFWFHTDASVRDGMSWEDFIDVEIELPPIDIQRKYVEIYKGIVDNQAVYETGLEDLKLVCDGYIENLRRRVHCENIGKYIICTDRKTNDLSIKIQGISNQKKFTDSNNRVEGVDKSKYLKIEPREFGYSPIHINEGSIALNLSDESFLLSPIYKTFSVIDESKLLPEYLMMWFARKEFNRYCWFYAFGSARDNFEWKQMCEFKIPIPDIKIQKSIAGIYNSYIIRKEINEQLKQQIKKICPLLIKGAIEEAKRS